MLEKVSGCFNSQHKTYAGYHANWAPNNGYNISIERHSECFNHLYDKRRPNVNCTKFQKNILTSDQNEWFQSTFPFQFFDFAAERCFRMIASNRLGGT